MGRKIVISSSMRFLEIVKSTMHQLRELGLEPLFPNLEYSNESSDVTKTSEEKAQLALDHFRAIEEAEAIYFILPEGYMGTSCKLELGYALALQKKIYFSEKTNDQSIDCYPSKIIPLDNLTLFTKE